ncbi:hypothetical protein [Helicobacter pylori]|uniref:hypothetical protein n=1 Tax=Helicobacter pylori TaxID=210 RepID=UPI001F08C6FF|nr:hypothetical protein [Helicobacter pylori]
MGNLASGHFKPTNNIQEQHNDRTLSPSYLLPKEFRGQNKVNRPSTQARELRERIIENAINIYENTKKKNAPKFKATSYQWSLVVNIKTNTTMSDLEKLAEHFEIKYGFQCYQIAIHRDEGYMDENNQPHINHHAHMEFITLDKNTGKNMMRKAHLSPRKFADMQTEIAQILGMERGTDKRVSGTERIEPRKYAQMKNKERKERLKGAELIDRLIRSISEFGTNNKILNQKIKAKNQKIDELQERPTTEQYSQLEQANSEQAQTIQEKDKEIATLNTINAKLEKTNKDLLNIIEQFFLLSLIYDNPTDEKTEKKAEKYKHLQVFNKLWNTIKLFYNIIEKLFGDKNAKKDHQDILNAITELQERPTKQQLEAKNKEINTLKQEKDNLTNQLQEQATETKKAQERVKTLENKETALKNDLNAKESVIQEKDKTISELQERPTKQQLEAKEKELNTLKQEKTDLKDKLQAQEKTITELNKFKNSSNLALDLEKAQERIQTLESNEIALIGVLYDKESII